MHDSDRHLSNLMRGMRQGQRRAFEKLADMLGAAGPLLQSRGMSQREWERRSRRWIPSLCLQVSRPAFQIPAHPAKWIQAQVEALWKSWLLDIQRDRASTEDFQRQMLPPSLFLWADIEVGAAFRPAEGLSGDVYDHAEIPGGLVVSLLDSMGHGPSAGLHVVHSLGALRASMPHGSISDLLVRLNGIMHRHQVDVEYASLVLARFDEQSLQVKIGNAGGVPPVLIADGEARVVDRGSYGLGMLETHPGTETAVELPAGGILMLLSDGVCEQEDPGGPHFGWERAVDVVRPIIHLPADRIAQAVLDAVSAHTAAPQGDDQTIVIVRRLVTDP
jgi:serine phosphatase RsbU (regulator of sigma subunit)